MVVFVETSAFISLLDEAIDTAFAFDRHFREQGFKVLLAGRGAGRRLVDGGRSPAD